ncbi:hypothetical protein ATO6_19545 [Oceanicola sp. 22II-s10i]|uniref:hypothetical protein n=1 Tax=Oceanicola sp. 22II-s10i TaxID=1317116 RepID=UPI000B527B9E|nr:hypothetical protein [Oceanicola sp. 22II-s10i]OWU83326.1 hypothetical protein ATO6_19545 [Oceanicola sp. 22II-s10i]
MKSGFIVACAMIGLAGPLAAQDVAAGKPLTFRSDWHDRNGGPYSPMVVACKSSSGLCLRDARMTPRDTQMQKTAHGLQVTYRAFGVIYLVQPGGKGTFYDLKGKPTGSFRWSQ